MTDPGFGQGLAGIAAVLGKPGLIHLKLAPQWLDTGDGWTDQSTGSRGEGCVQHVTRCIGRRGPRQHHWLPMQRGLDQREDLAGETRLPGGDDGGGVAVIRAVDDQCPGVVERDPPRDAFIQEAMDHPAARLLLSVCPGQAWRQAERISRTLWWKSMTGPGPAAGGDDGTHKRSAAIRGLVGGGMVLSDNGSTVNSVDAGICPINGAPSRRNLGRPRGYSGGNQRLPRTPDQFVEERTTPLTIRTRANQMWEVTGSRKNSHVKKTVQTGMMLLKR